MKSKELVVKDRKIGIIGLLDATDTVEIVKTNLIKFIYHFFDVFISFIVNKK